MASQHDPATQQPDKSKSHANRRDAGDAALNDAAQNEVVSHKVSKVTWQIGDGASDGERRERIAKAAYFLAERRGFEPGHEAEDWAAAELEVGGPEDGREMPRT
jgi:hypothetical protein